MIKAIPGFADVTCRFPNNLKALDFVIRSNPSLIVNAKPGDDSSCIYIAYFRCIIVREGAIFHLSPYSNILPG